MVKADAYGLGAVAIANALESLEPWGYGVATLDEAAELRDSGIRRRILVFTPLLPSDFEAARRLEVVPTLGAPDSIELWARNIRARWHLAIDTGMNRAGIGWHQVAAVRDLAAAHPPEGAYTHFHSADRNDGSMQLQQDRFNAAVAALPARPRYLHAENSPAVERQSPSPWDLVRPGVFLYGVGGSAGAAIAPELVASVRARIVEVREVPNGESVSYAATWRATGARRVATVAAGYADGIRRLFGNRGAALVHGRRVPIAGIVTMDMTMLDVTGVDCVPGDVATFAGRDGGATIDLNDFDRELGLSPYEFLTGLGQRASRVYVE
jgi:alanine racemase